MYMPAQMLVEQMEPMREMIATLTDRIDGLERERVGLLTALWNAKMVNNTAKLTNLRGKLKQVVDELVRLEKPLNDLMVHSRGLGMEQRLYGKDKVWSRRSARVTRRSRRRRSGSTSKRSSSKSSKGSKARSASLRTKQQAMRTKYLVRRAGEALGQPRGMRNPAPRSPRSSTRIGDSRSK